MRWGIVNNEYIQLEPYYYLEEDNTTVQILVTGFTSLSRGFESSGTSSGSTEYFIENYGLLYNYYAISDSRQITPDGWHVPTRAEISTFIDNVAIANSVIGYEIGDEYIYGDPVFSIRKTGETFWSSNTDSTDSLHFSFVGSGNRYNGSFHGIKEFVNYMTSSTYGSNDVYIFQVGGGSSTTGTLPNDDGDYSVWISYEQKHNGFSLRYIKDSSTYTEGETMVGNDGKVYKTVKLNDQVWVAENIAETKYRNGDYIPEITSKTTWTGLTTGAMCAYDNDWENVTGTHADTFEISMNSITPLGSGIVSGTGSSYSHIDLITLTSIPTGNNEQIEWVDSISSEVLSDWTVFQLWASSDRSFNLSFLEIATTNIKHGYLYNYYTAVDTRKITSSDTWRVPTRTEIIALATNSNAIKSRFFRPTSSSISVNQNSYKFTIKGSGDRTSYTGSFQDIDAVFQMMTLTLSSTNYYIGQCSKSSNLSTSSTLAKAAGTSIRLVRDATVEEQTQSDGTYMSKYVGNDGYEYNTVKIGILVWTTENLVETIYRNSDAIPEVTDNTSWKNLLTGARCSYNNSTTNAFIA